MEEFLIVLLIVAVLWLLVKQAQRSARSESLDDLRALVDRLEQRIAALERTPRQPAEARPPQPEPTPIHIRPTHQTLRPYAPIVTPVAPVVTPVPPPPPIQPIPEPTRHISLEERLGQNWLNKLGIVSLVIGIALFLGYQLRTLGPLGKSLTGYALALVLLLGGVWLERREQYRLFARAGIGGGWALTFFVTFALYHLDAMQVLHSQGVDLVLMLIVAAAMVGHSLLYKSQVVTSLAFLLAFATVGISHVTLFSLVAGALLAIGLVVVAFQQRWFPLALAGLLGLYGNHFLWLLRVLPEGGHPGHTFPEFLPSAGLLLLYWLLFRVLYVFRTPETDQQQLVSSATAILNSAGLLLLLKYQSSQPEWAFAALLVLGCAEMGFAFLGRSRWRTSFVVLSTIGSAALLAAIPFRFSGAHWTLLWLLEAEVLFLAGVRIPETVFRRLGTLAGLLAASQILIFDVIPIVDLRTGSTPDPSQHWSVVVALFAAAALFWFNAEFATRRWRPLFAAELDRGGMFATNYLAAVMLATGLWVVVASPWAAIAWLAAALALAYTGRALGSLELATQADLLTFATLTRLVVINLNLPGTVHPGHPGFRALTLAIAAVLLYSAAFRNAASRLLPVLTVPVVYTWAASTLVVALLWMEVWPPELTLAWGLFALILFEAGTLSRLSFLRHQAYALLALTFARSFLVDMEVFDIAGLTANPGSDVYFSPTRTHRLLTVVPLIAAAAWVYERTRRVLSDFKLDQQAGVLACWSGTLAAAALLHRVILPTQQLVIAWAALAALLLYMAWLLAHPIFTAQSLTVLAAATADAAIVHLLQFQQDRTFYLGTACALMLAALPAAFAIRRQRLATAPDSLLTHPEQPFFFVPLVLIAALIAVELTGGHITIGWIALGLVAFLAALPIGERSFRLGGLSLLMLGLGKIVVIDIWSASPTDRYLTLIVTGASLLLVSFLYSRYRETILKFL